MSLIKLTIEGASISYTDSGGDGEPMLLLHGGGLAGFMTPLAAEPDLAGYRVIRMIRAGYDDQPVPDGLMIADHARHAAVLLGMLNATPAHVVAHSAAASIALELAVAYPHAVRTLALIEPPLIDTLADPADLDGLHAAFGPIFGAVMGSLAQGDTAAAFDVFMAFVCGPDYRAVMDYAVGKDAVDAAAANSLTFFTSEAPALTAWTFDPVPKHPVLLIQGELSLNLEHRLIAYLAGLLPDATVLTVPGVNHLMPLTAPSVLAKEIKRFAVRQEQVSAANH